MLQRRGWRWGCQRQQVSQNRRQACLPRQSRRSQMRVLRLQSLWSQRQACWHQRQALMLPQMLAADSDHPMSAGLRLRMQGKIPVCK